LDELGAIENLSLGVASMVLTITVEREAPENARILIERAKQEVTQLSKQQGVIEMINKIMVYKFNTLSREEIAAMLGTNVEDIRAFREAKEEGAREIALNMLRKNLDLETIAEVTGLTIAQVQDLQLQIK
jgi:predicted transposase YdaD